ncbi:mucin-3A-like [Ruditapes philippinarum]|uniref:mucin-3A-like n=1 Tax=Ruditapes philippinarum TaxID=129788 RepID=UPI00295AAE48|nr:mucin-3A-like [Ruditapes philippinarum]XP_060600483.1 mucin-3A-like [Ruditapes philippinarum]
MKDKVVEKNVDYPENPPWTMFFDGPLYQEYDKFMKTKDFSQILLNTKLRLANNSQSPEAINPAYTLDDEHWEKQQDVDPTGSTYQYVSEDYYQRISEDEKRRTRRTRAFIIISLVIMAALAFGTALVIHFVFIEPLDTPKHSLNVSSFGNVTSTDQPGLTTPVPMEKQTEQKPLQLEDLLKVPDHSPHDHRPHDHSPHDDSTHDHILNPVGKIFDDQFSAVTEITTTETPVTSTMSTSTTSISTTTLTYLLHLNPYSGSDGDHVHMHPKDKSKLITTTRVTSVIKKAKKKPTSTTLIDHIDFFGMDDSASTTQSMNTTLSDADFFGIDEYYYDETTISKPETSPQVTSKTPSVTTASNAATSTVNSSGSLTSSVSTHSGHDSLLKKNTTEETTSKPKISSIVEVTIVP